MGGKWLFWTHKMRRFGRAPPDLATPNNTSNVGVVLVGWVFAELYGALCADAVQTDVHADVVSGPMQAVPAVSGGGGG